MVLSSCSTITLYPSLFRFSLILFSSLSADSFLSQPLFAYSPSKIHFLKIFLQIHLSVCLSVSLPLPLSAFCFTCSFFSFPPSRYFLTLCLLVCNYMYILYPSSSRLHSFFNTSLSTPPLRQSLTQSLVGPECRYSKCTVTETGSEGNGHI